LQFYRREGIMIGTPSDDQNSGFGIAVVGAGYWGKNLVRNFANLNALSAVCDSNTDTLRMLGEQYPQCRTLTSYQEGLGDESIRAVAIATPAESHDSMVREALIAGKDVFVEKP